MPIDRPRFREKIRFGYFARLWLSAVVLPVFCASAVWAGIAGTSDLRRLQDDLVTQRAMAIAHERRLTSAGDEILLAKLDAAEGVIRARARDLARSQAQRDAARAELAPVIAERDRLRERYGESDVAYAAEIAEYQNQIAGLLRTDDPKLQAALQQFADGDRVGAFPVIEAIMRAQIKASDAATNAQAAIQMRQLAGLASAMRGRGEKTIADVIPIWEEAQRRTPAYHQGWVELSDLYTEAGRLPAATDAARRSVATAVMPRQKAAAHHILGNALRLAGDLTAAREQFGLSLAITRQELALTPSVRAKRRDVAIAQTAMSDVLFLLGDVVGARASLEEAVSILRPIAAGAPDDTAAQYELAAALYTLGGVLEAAGDSQASRTNFEEALATARRLAAVEPHKSEFQRLIGLSLCGLGDSLTDMQDLAGARAGFVECAQIMHTLAASDQGDALAQAFAAESLRKSADGLAQIGDTAGAKLRFEESLAMTDRLYAADPGNVDNRRAMAEDLRGLIDAALETGRIADAMALSERLVALRRALATADPTGMAAANELGNALKQSGDVLRQVPDLPAAKTRYDDAIGVQRRTVAARPGDGAVRLRLAETLSGVGEALAIAHDDVGARAKYVESVTITRDLARIAPGNIQVLTRLSSDLIDIGGLGWDGRDDAGTTKAYLDAVTVLRRLAVLAPAVARSRLGETLGRLGDLQVAAGADKAAADYYQESFDIAERAANARPTDNEATRFLAKSLSRIGVLLLQTRDLENARHSLADAADHYRRLIETVPVHRHDQRELAAALVRLGEIDDALHASPDGKRDYAEALSVSRRYVVAEPADMAALADLAEAATGLATLTGDQAVWKEAATALETLDRHGVLAAQDRPKLAAVHAHLISAGAAP